MKQIKLFFLIFFLCLCIFGCDEGMIDPMQLAQVADNIPHYETTVQTELPDDVLAAMKLKADEMSKIVNIRIHDEQHITELTTPEQVQNWNEQRQWLLDNGYDKIDFHELQKSYYTKYIDAAGIAIVAPQHTRTKYLLDARDAIVVMTSKYPELRERLLSKHGKFYMVLIPQTQELDQFPEVQLHIALLDDDPHNSFLGNSCSLKNSLEIPHLIGLCWAAVNLDTSSAQIFVHEFAHVLEIEMERLQPGFRNTLREYYGTGGSLPWYEYWARTVEAWFYLTPTDGYEEFIEKYGVVGELLDYWFPQVRLKKEYLPPVYDETIAHQAYAILEKHCLECHGENGTQKDVLVIKSTKQLYDERIISVNGADKSRLFLRILGHHTYGPQMPLGREPLSDKEINIIENWLNFSGKIIYYGGKDFHE